MDQPKPPQKTVERLAYFSFHPADYLLDTTDLTLGQHGAYLMLMLRYYWQGGLTVVEAHRISKTDAERADVDAVLARYFHREGDALRHNRIDRELEKIARYVEHQSKAGRASARARSKDATAHAKGNGADPAPLPEWIDADTFRRWIKIRPAKARTPDAQAAAVKKLDRFRAEGIDPNAVVAESLSNGWQGLFKPDKARGAGGATLAERNEAARLEAVRRIKERPDDDTR